MSYFPLRNSFSVSSSRLSGGFTLIEMVVTIVLIAIIAAVLSPFIKYNVDSYVDTRIRAELTAKGRTVLERLTREIREADPDPSNITITGGNTIEFIQLGTLTGITNIGGILYKTYDFCPAVKIGQSGTSLLWDEGADGYDSILSDSVSSVSFDFKSGTSAHSPVVTVKLTLAEDGETVQFYREIHIINTIGTAGTTITCSPVPTP